uniref:RING-type domain-containing protein n=1 Tax=Ditylenchus dipsaci TaxID=166011 RepID=A0A915EKF6_9BILA
MTQRKTKGRKRGPTITDRFTSGGSSRSGRRCRQRFATYSGMELSSSECSSLASLTPSKNEEGIKVEALEEIDQTVDSAVANHFSSGNNFRSKRNCKRKFVNCSGMEPSSSESSSPASLVSSKNEDVVEELKTECFRENDVDQIEQAPSYDHCASPAYLNSCVSVSYGEAEEEIARGCVFDASSSVEVLSACSAPTCYLEEEDDVEVIGEQARQEDDEPMQYLDEEEDIVVDGPALFDQSVSNESHDENSSGGSEVGLATMRAARPEDHAEHGGLPDELAQDAVFNEGSSSDDLVPEDILPRARRSAAGNAARRIRMISNHEANFAVRGENDEVAAFFEQEQVINLSDISLPSSSDDDFGGVRGISEKVTCIICAEEDAVNPVKTICCGQNIGCKKCAKQWYRTTNISHLNSSSPLSRGQSHRNHKRCLFCREDWSSKMLVTKC